MASRLREDVEALAAMERRSASAGERASAQWVAGRLREAGAEDVRVESFRYQHTFAHAQGAHFAAGLAAAVLGRRALAAATLVSFELEYSGRSQWLRRLLPAGEGANAVGRVPARGERRRTVVLVAHHDAAGTGLMWDPRLLRAGNARAARTGRRPSLALLPEAALVALGVTGRRAAGRLGAGAVLATALGLSAEVARGPTVPGANDNASGVAAVLELVARLASHPLPGTEVIAVAPGCEESGMGGMAAWLRGALEGLRASDTLVLGLDTVGSGEPVVLDAEGGLWPVRYAEEDVALTERGAARAGLAAPRRFRLGAWTDPVLARLAGLRAVSILSIREGGFPNYHLPTDTPERVDWESLERCVSLAAGVVEEWSAPDGP